MQRGKKKSRINGCDVSGWFFPFDVWFNDRILSLEKWLHNQKK